MIDYTLKKGSHPYPEVGMCAMEWTAYVAGEEHTAKPRCVDPFLANLAIAANDRLPDDQRQRLRPYLARMIGTGRGGFPLDRRPPYEEMVYEWERREPTAAYAVLGATPSFPEYKYKVLLAPDYRIEVTLRPQDMLTWGEATTRFLDLLDLMLPTEAVELPEAGAREYERLLAGAPS